MNAASVPSNRSTMIMNRMLNYRKNHPPNPPPRPPPLQLVSKKFIFIFIIIIPVIINNALRVEYYSLVFIIIIIDY